MYRAAIVGKFIFTYRDNIRLTMLCNNAQSIQKLKQEGYKILIDDKQQDRLMIISNQKGSTDLLRSESYKILINNIK